MSRTPITPREQLTHFLGHSPWADLMETDLNVAPGRSGSVKIAFVAPWTELGHTSSALTLFDRELRRAVTVWDDWTAPTLDDELVGFGVRAETRIGESLARALAAHPEPKRGLGALRIVATQPDPTVAVVEPTGRLHDMLGELPTSTLLYAMSAFGQDMRVSQYWHVDRTLATLGGLDDVLDLVHETRRGRWPGTGHQFARHESGVGGRPSHYRAVTPPPDDRGGAYAVVYAEDDTDCTVATIELAPNATSTAGLVLGGTGPRLL